MPSSGCMPLGFSHRGPARKRTASVPHDASMCKRTLVTTRARACADVPASCPDPDACALSSQSRTARRSARAGFAPHWAESLAQASRRCASPRGPCARPTRRWGDPAGGGPPAVEGRVEWRALMSTSCHEPAAFTGRATSRCEKVGRARPLGRISDGARVGSVAEPQKKPNVHRAGHFAHLWRNTSCASLSFCLAGARCMDAGRID